MLLPMCPVLKITSRYFFLDCCVKNFIGWWCKLHRCPAMICFSNTFWHIRISVGVEGLAINTGPMVLGAQHYVFLKMYHNNIYIFFFWRPFHINLTSWSFCVLQVLIRWSNVVLINIQGYFSDFKWIVLLIYVFI